MPIQIIKNENGETCPVVVCDFCGGIIANAEEGCAIYSCKIPSVPKFSHRGECHNSLEIDMDFGGWQPLEYFLHWLTQNCSFKPLSQDPYSIGG
jgi:hypothetical protein